MVPSIFFSYLWNIRKKQRQGLCSLFLPRLIRFDVTDSITKESLFFGYVYKNQFQYKKNAWCLKYFFHLQLEKWGFHLVVCEKFLPRTCLLHELMGKQNVLYYSSSRIHNTVNVKSQIIGYIKQNLRGSSVRVNFKEYGVGCFLFQRSVRKINVSNCLYKCLFDFKFENKIKLYLIEFDLECL